MNKIKQAAAVLNAHKQQIITRTVIVAAGVVAVTLASGLVKVVPTEVAVEAVENVAKAVKKAAE